jgi:PAS domain S-box-containing protein
VPVADFNAPRVGADLERLVDALSGYVLIGLDTDGRIETVSAGAEGVLGFRPQELVGCDVQTLFPVEQDGAEGFLASAMDGQGGRRLLRLARKSGEAIWCMVGLYPVRDDGGDVAGLTMICRDAGEEQAQRESERRLRLMLDCVRDYAICFVSPSGTVADWNEGAAQVTGYRAQEIVGRHFGCFYTAAKRRAGEPARALEIARSEGAYECEGWRLRKDGGRFWAWVMIDAVHDEAGEIVGFANVMRDITERRVAQEALRESERQFRLLVNGVADHALYMLDPNGIIVSWNAGAERIKGYTADEVIGQHYSKFFTESDRMAGLPVRGLYSAMERGRYEAEGWRVRKDGSLFWANVVVHPIRDKGVLVGFAKITRDATAHRHAQAELQKTQERLFHAQKLEALGQLTGGVAHDFNNLLMIVGGQAELLRRGGAEPERTKRAAETIAAATERGAALTRQLLSFARRQPLRSQVIQLQDRISAFEQMLAKSLGERLRLSLALPPDLWPVEIDANEFELALINLAVNARDAMPEGGALSISAENVVFEQASAELDLKGEFVAITFTDTGVGIPADILPKVFDPFFTTKPAERGTGLGLSQVYGFARQAGGEVTVTSRLGEGASFTIYLPRAQSQAREVEKTDAMRKAGGGLALVVEDNPDVAEVTTGLVSMLGYDVRVAGSAEAALEALEGGEAFDLVVSDVVMTGRMDGVDLARRLREDRPDLPLLLVSGYAKALNDAASTFAVLQKPFTLEGLEQGIASAIRLCRGAAQPKVVQLSEARRTRPKP